MEENMFDAVGRNWKFRVNEIDEWIKSGQAAE